MTSPVTSPASSMICSPFSWKKNQLGHVSKDNFILKLLFSRLPCFTCGLFIDKLNEQIIKLFNNKTDIRLQRQFHWLFNECVSGSTGFIADWETQCSRSAIEWKGNTYQQWVFPFWRTTHAHYEPFHGTVPQAPVSVRSFPPAITRCGCFLWISTISWNETQ